MRCTYIFICIYMYMGRRTRRNRSTRKRRMRGRGPVQPEYSDAPPSPPPSPPPSSVDRIFTIVNIQNMLSNVSFNLERLIRLIQDHVPERANMLRDDVILADMYYEDITRNMYRIDRLTEEDFINSIRIIVSFINQMIVKYRNAQRPPYRIVDVIEHYTPPFPPDDSASAPPL